MAALLLAYHAVVSPLALQRCEMNPKTGVHVNSITNSNKKFVPNNHKYITEKFRTMFPDVSEPEWFQLHRVKIVIERMLAEVCRPGGGRWQWRGFHLEEYEKEELPYKILQVFLAGADVL